MASADDLEEPTADLERKEKEWLDSLTPEERANRLRIKEQLLEKIRQGVEFTSNISTEAGFSRAAQSIEAMHSHSSSSETTGKQDQPADGKSAGVPGDSKPVDDPATLATFASLLDENAIKALAIAQDKAKTVEEKLRLLATLDVRYNGKSSKELGELLRVSEQAIRKTNWWRSERDRN